MTTELVARVKQLRAELKRIESGILGLPGSRPASIARTHVETAGMYLGKVLQEIGEANPGLVRDPYPTSRDSTNPGIDPTAPEARLNPDLVCPRPG